MFHQAYTSLMDPADVEDELHFRAESIVDNVHFATKSQSTLLQIADHAAFIVRRRLSNHADVAELYNLIGPQLRQESGAEKSYALHVPVSYLKPVDESGT